MKMLNEVSNSRRNSSDRFIPRRANTNFDLSYYFIRKPNDTNSSNVLSYSDSDWFINTARIYYNLQQYRSELWKAMMPESDRVLVFSSPKKKTKSNKAENQDLWPVHPRSRPLLGPPSVILDMPDLDTNISHQVVDWGKRGYIGTIYEREVHLWHPQEQLKRHITNTHRRVQSCLKWNADGTKFSMALDMGTIAVWDCQSCKVTNFGECACGEYCVVTAMEWTSSNHLITGCSNGELRSWSPDLICIKWLFKAHSNDIINIKVSCKENNVVTTGMDRKVRIWKWPSLEEIFEISFSEAPVKALAWHPWKDSLLAIGGPKCTTLWNVNSVKRLGSNYHIRENSLVDSLTFNPLSAELVVSYYSFCNNGDGIHFLSVLRDLEHIIDEGQFHNGRVPYLLWDASGTKLATASADENLCIWDFFGTATDTEKRYLKKSRKKKFSTNMFNNLNIFNSYIR